MTNMKNKSRMTVVTSLTGFPSKSGALEMLVSLPSKNILIVRILVDEFSVQLPQGFSIKYCGLYQT